PDVRLPRDRRAGHDRGVSVSVTAPAGFRAAGVAAGLKASGRPDVGLLVSDLPASAAGLFTTNAFAAAPVHACRGRLPSGRAAARGDGFVVGGCAKGAGMIAPDLATLLVFLTTDAVAAPDAVRHALREGAGPVWNALTIDGCSSTNDTVLLLANGSSGIAPHP